MELITAFLMGLSAIISAIGTLIITAYKTKKQLQETIPMKIRKQNDIDLEIIQRMETVKELLNADRVQVYEYHNGGHWANGRSAMKTDCSYEVVKAGVKPCQMLLQNIPLSLIPHFHKKLLDEECLYVPDIENIKEEMPSTYSIKSDQGIKSFYDIILNNKQGEPIGFIGIQYVNSYHKTYTNSDRDEMLRLKFFIEENLEKMVKK